MSTARELRLAFDGGFARPLGEARADQRDLLAIRIGGEPHAIELSEIGSLVADRPITPVPSSARALLGIVGIRGAILPVFDLGACLGYPRATAPRWIVTAEHLGFAFEVLEGHLRVEIDDPQRSIVRLASVIAEIENKEA